jgi:hypothetical protein
MRRPNRKCWIILPGRCSDLTRTSSWLVVRTPGPMKLSNLIEDLFHLTRGRCVLKVPPSKSTSGHQS